MPLQPGPRAPEQAIVAFWEPVGEKSSRWTYVAPWSAKRIETERRAERITTCLGRLPDGRTAMYRIPLVEAPR